jgi:hypothetical protein
MLTIISHISVVLQWAWFITEKESTCHDVYPESRVCLSAVVSIHVHVDAFAVSVRMTQHFCLFVMSLSQTYTVLSALYSSCVACDTHHLGGERSICLR